MKIISSIPVSMPEAREILEAREKEKELGYEQKLAADHLKKFAKLKSSEAKKLIEELGSVVKMSPTTMAQLVNLLPKTADELRLVFSREKFSLKEDETKRILDILKNYG